MSTRSDLRRVFKDLREFCKRRHVLMVATFVLVLMSQQGDNFVFVGSGIYGWINNVLLAACRSFQTLILLYAIHLKYPQYNMDNASGYEFNNVVVSVVSIIGSFYTPYLALKANVICLVMGYTTYYVLLVADFILRKLEWIEKPRESLENVYSGGVYAGIRTRSGIFNEIEQRLQKYPSPRSKSSTAGSPRSRASRSARAATTIPSPRQKEN